jgi:peptidyl-prolyl cis-trans isomerase C
MSRAIASHILVDSETLAAELKTKIDGGESFADLAKEHSSCPSGQGGGSLGEFGQGDMVPEFDQIVFSDLPIGQCSEPVKTQFGYHVLMIDKRIG